MRYSGHFGFAQSDETAPGVMTETITERKFVGEVKQRTETLRIDGEIFPVYSTNTSVSVLSRGNHEYSFDNLRWLTYAGKKWRPRSVVHEPPRVTVHLGDEWNE